MDSNLTRERRATWSLSMAWLAGTTLLGCGASKLIDAAAIAAGGFHTCAVRRDGTASCWGSNAFGQLGDGRMDHGQCTAGVDCADSPWPVATLTAIAELRAGLDHTCARTTAGAVQCWGANESGQCGATLNPVPTPTLVSGLNDVQELTLGARHSCARIASGAVQCWGSNASGQLGTSAVAGSTAAPITVEQLSNATGLAAGTAHTCALRTDGSVVCWGDNSLGQLGNGSTASSMVPVVVAGLADAVEITAGGAHTCARRQDGRVVCWGLDSHGQLGDGENPRAVCHSGAEDVDCALLPSQVAGLGEAAQIVAGTSHTCARRPSGAVFCWGSNARGQLGDLSAMHATCADGTDCAFAPVPIGEVTDAAEVTAGGDHACVRRAYGDVLCWGDNAYGQVGTPRGMHASCAGEDCVYQPTSVTGVH